MIALRRRTLRQKLALVVIGALTAALLLSSVGLLAWDIRAARRALVADLESQAAIVAENTSAALAFNDPEAADATLKTLSAQPTIIQACLYDASRVLFTAFRTDAPPCPPDPGRDGLTSADGSLAVTRAVALDDRRIGTLVLRSNLADVYSRLRAQAAGIALVLVTSSVLALVLTTRLLKLVTDPVVSLAHTARAVSDRKDYSLRATRRGDDEVGLLVTAFNEMLAEIQVRDEELRRANDELERRVQERTRALREQLDERRRAEAELAARNAELLRSNQDLDDFAYIASHDLREPLRGIHNYASFLTEDYADRLDPEGVAKLETLRRLSRRMEDLIESLLYYSRLGRVDLAMADVDLTAVVEDVIESLEIRLRELRVDVRICRPLPIVHCDRVRVAEVFRNLITNAMKYNDKPERWIEIGSTHRPGEPVVVSVRDNGIGIADKHLEAVFRIFKRLHPRDHYGGGTGVGLTIVRKIIERHHGRIWIDSAVGTGTTVSFTLEDSAHDNRDGSARSAGGG